MHKSLRLVIAAVSIGAAAACGGGGPSGPKPLSHHLDDMHIARVPVSKKQPVIQAQNEYSVAKMEHSKAETDLDEIKTELKVAKNEREQAVLAEESARSEKQAADKSADMTRVNNSMRKLRAAELERKAADEKVEYLKSRKKALKKYIRYTKENMYAKEASYELAKAKVAKSNNIRPKGFEYQKYESQAQSRAERVRSAKAKANEAAQKAEQRRKKWQGLLKKAQQARGGGSSASSGTGSL